MSKNYSDYKYLKIVSKSINKKGVIKGDSKKETKKLKRSCEHHYITKKGKVNPNIIPNSDGTVTCKACGARFTTKKFDDDTLEKRIGGTTEVVDQAKFLNVAIDGGSEAENFLVTLSQLLGQLPKVYKNIRSIAYKGGKKKKKKNNGQKNTGSLGNWGSK